MRQYARHRRFVKDVERMMKNEENMEKLIVFASNYISLRQIHSDEISNRDIVEIVKKVSFVDFELLDLYRTLLNDLSNQEFIFRIKRVKYIENTKDSVAIVSSPLLEKIGKHLMSETITMKTKSVRFVKDGEEREYEELVDIGKMDENVETKKQTTPSVQAKDTVRAKDTMIMYDTSDPSSLDYVCAIWNDSEKRLDWLMKNMKYTSTKYNYDQKNGYTPEEIAERTGRNVLTVKWHLRKYIMENVSKYAPKS